jgi:hypothetical protein
LSIALAGELPVAAETLLEWLSSPAAEQPAAMWVTNAEVWGGLSLWLAMKAPDLCSLIAEGEWTTRGLPCLVAFSSRRAICSTLGLVGPMGAAFLCRLPQPDPAAKSDDEAPFELHISGYGADGGTETAGALMTHLSAWQAANRPGSANLRLRVYPLEPLHEPQPGALVVRKEASQVVIDWPKGL